MNKLVIAACVCILVLVIFTIASVSGSYGVEKKASIKEGVYEYFKKAWLADEPEAGKETFFKRFFELFVQAYEYEIYKESVNKRKFRNFKLLVLFIILCVPFLALFLIMEKASILGDGEVSELYLYSIVLVPVVFAFLVNKYTKISQYHEIWYRHMRNRHYMEWRMMVFVKDYELLKEGLKTSEQAATPESLKIDFINDMSAYWKTETDGISSNAGAKEENIFEDIGKLFGKE